MRPECEQDYLAAVEEIIAQGPYSADWDSLMQAKTPEWFLREKLGIFIHWGIYSVPAFGSEWYSRNMYIQGSPEYEHHIRTYGPHNRFGYRDFIPLFAAERFDPDAWMKLFSEAGAGYVFPVAEHHDGFQMYESSLSGWNAKEMGPHRDILGELKRAAGAHGMQFCTSSHRAEHWFFMSHGREFDSDIREPMEKGDFYWPAMPEPDHHDLRSMPYPDEVFLKDWLARTAELILKYRPKLLYFDWWIQHEAFKPYLKKLAAFYYNCGKMWGQEVLICYKYDAMMSGTGIVEMERGGFADAKPYPWQTDTAVARNSWCYTDSLVYKSSSEIICTLLDVVSKNGNLLLNIGPKADGTIPDGDRRILEDLAAWMKVNGVAVTGAKVWRKPAEGPTKAPEGQFSDQAEPAYTKEDYRFTVNHGCIFAACLKCPEDGCFRIRSLAERRGEMPSGYHGLTGRVEILGYHGRVRWQADADGLSVTAEDGWSGSDVDVRFPVVIKITME